MKPPEDLQSIVAAGLCVGCGLCQAMTDSERVQMVNSLDGALRPKAQSPLDDGSLDRIRVTCPGIRIDGSEPAMALEAELDLIWGPLITLQRAAAGEAGRGLARQLADYLETSGAVEATLVPEDPDAGPRAAGLVNLRRRLDEGRSLAVFGRPCEIAGLRNLAQLDNRVGRLVVLTISHFCSGLDRAGRPAKLGEVEALQFRCRICPDSSGEQADIVWGASDEGLQGDSSGDDVPQGVLLGRSLRGAAVIEAMAEKTSLARAPLSVEQVNQAYAALRTRKEDLWAKLTALAVSRRLRPRYRSLRIWAAGRSSGWGRKWRIFRAMRRSIKGKKLLEPAP